MDPSQHPPPRTNIQKLTRRRTPLSCVACRVRKLKCNREKPCHNCIVRGDSAIAACTYTEKPNGRLSSKTRSDAADMRSRIDRLEKSILSIMAEKNKPSTPASLPESRTSESASNDSDAAGAQLYSLDTRSTHWDAILHEIEAMKDVWSEEKDQNSSLVDTQAAAYSNHRPSLLSGLMQPPDRSIIVGDIPCKHICDKLVSRFFDDYNPLLPAKYVLHKPTFLKQYNIHWADPSKTRIIWIGLLFSVLCLAMQSYIRNNDLDGAPSLYRGNLGCAADLARRRTAECLVIADITVPKELLIETLLLHSLAEYSAEKDGPKGVTLISSIIMCLALQQGYHRDPSQYPNLTVFQGEMRRRIWAIVNQLELLWAAQTGIPKHIKHAECDTELFCNIYEEELFEEMETLPPSRPLTEQTGIGYMIVKARIMQVFGHVIEFLHIVEEQPYDEVMRLDMMLLNAKESIPPHLQLRPLEEMQGDPPSLIMERFILQQYCHKTACVLHRKYWNQSSSGSIPSLFYSRNVSMASSMALLENQASIHQASAPGGPLENMKWYQFSMTNHDFLLAAMIVALDLNYKQDSQTGCYVQQEQKLLALQRSRTIWTEVVNDCRDAKRAINILNRVFDRLRANPEYSNLFLSAERKEAIPPLQPGLDVSSAAISEPWILRPNVYPFSERFGLPSQVAPINGSSALEDNAFASFGANINMPLDFDWDAWDQFVHNDISEH